MNREKKQHDAENALLLAIETSCDDSAAALVTQQGNVPADVVLSQTQAHAPYQGIVPEIASRCHLVQIVRVVRQAFQQANRRADDVTHVAVTCAPGLIGSLLVGAQFAKGFAQARGIPLIGVHHIEGHIAASRAQADYPNPPFIALIASGGHSALYACRAPFQFQTLGRTRDDAAGEAFDKAAKMLGLGYPGGQVVDRLAKGGDPNRFPFPAALPDKRTLDYSFSGLKTAVRNQVIAIKQTAGHVTPTVQRDLCASVRAAIVRALLDKALLACAQTGIRSLVLGGGVAANSLLRDQAVKRTRQAGIALCLPPRQHCTDNAVMIAHAARARLQAGFTSSLAVPVRATLPLEETGAVLYGRHLSL
ncbi:MAG: tRNA (adenosine(37)-N6)-threonylcarbamoyltransferase complex transferase subunit TsaD [Myxococcota bacterium]